MSQPRQLDTPLYRLLHEEKIAEFNKQKPREGAVDLRCADLRGLDLRLLDANRIDFTDAYLRGADLRGLDLREASLEGASIAHAQISGTYFPETLDANEILLSLQFGTRMRCRPA